MVARAGQTPPRTRGASRPDQYGRHAAGGFRRAPARRPVDRALTVPRPRRQRPATPGATGESVPRRRAPRGLPARTVAEGAPHAVRQPADRRRRRTREDHRSGTDPDPSCCAAASDASWCGLRRRFAGSGATSCGRSSRSDSSWRTATRRISPDAASAWTPIPGVRSTVSSPPYHYLRQPDVREEFLSACHTPEGRHTCHGTC